MRSEGKSLWEMLWDYDPNGLLVTDSDLCIKVANPAFCQMFRCKAEDLVGQPASDFLVETAAFQKAWDTDSVLRVDECRYERYELVTRQVLFPIRDQGVIACIFVDITQESLRREESILVKRETLGKIQEVVDKQMKVAQEIASLLGETTAETKTSLLRLVNLIEQELR